MSDATDRRDKQVMVRLSEREYAALLGAATGQQRKPADMARVAMMRGLHAPDPAAEAKAA